MITNKTIEFIEKEIEKLKEFLELDDVLCLSTDEDYKFWYNRLKMFQQIKEELDAWEVVKKYLILDKEFHQIDLHLHHNTKYKEDYLKLKKALRVE